IAQVHRERFKKFSSGRTIMRMNFQPSVDEWPDQPGPNRTLMISAVARSEIATVNWFIIWIVGREGAQANWRDQFFLDDFQDGFPMFSVEDGMIERDREQLI